MKTKMVVKWLFFDALNFQVITRLWRVTYGDWNGGRFKCFWFRKNAIKFAESRNNLFVDLKNDLTGECIRIRNNPEKVQPPTIHYYTKGDSYVENFF